MEDTSPTAVTPATTGYFKLEGKFTHLKATHDFSRCISHLPATLGRAKGRSAEDPGYVHIGDCKSISKKNATITFDGHRGLFVLTVLGKNRVLVNGQSITNGSEPVPLHNKSAIRMGSANGSDNNSKFYFLLPLDRPTQTTAQLCLEVADEYTRAGQQNELTGRMVTEQIQRKYPFFAAADELKILTRKVYSYCKRQKAFERLPSTEELKIKYGKKVIVYRYVSVLEGVGGEGGAGSEDGGSSGSSGSSSSSSSSSSRSKKRSSSVLEEEEQQGKNVLAKKRTRADS